jgi:hypothetical protein
VIFYDTLKLEQFFAAKLLDACIIWRLVLSGIKVAVKYYAAFRGNGSFSGNYLRNPVCGYFDLPCKFCG